MTTACGCLLRGVTEGLAQQDPARWRPSGSSHRKRTRRKMTELKKGPVMVKVLPSSLPAKATGQTKSLLILGLSRLTVLVDRVSLLCAIMGDSQGIMHSCHILPIGQGHRLQSTSKPQASFAIYCSSDMNQHERLRNVESAVPLEVQRPLVVCHRLETTRCAFQLCVTIDRI